MDNNAKKDALLSVMQPASPALPKLSRPKLELSGTDRFRCKLFAYGRRVIGGRHFAGELFMFKGRHFD